MSLREQKVILLFFRDFERDKLFRYDRYFQRLLRPIYLRFKTGPKVTGFLMWYNLIVKSLRQKGYQVFVNRYDLARKNPNYPVGLIGYPHLLDGWKLPNPALLGPALFDHPNQAPDLMKDSRFKLYIVTSQWMMDVFASVYLDSCVLWYAGIDLEMWADTRYLPKENDILIYDKIRWNRDYLESHLLNYVTQTLENQKLSYQIIRYQHYDHDQYRSALQKSKAMIFLCEHETQGMAYQEALASNVPVLAWDNGYWLDPNRSRYTQNAVLATSVPYFSEECGERFCDIHDFSPIFSRFWSNFENYNPRAFVERELSMEGSAEVYASHYFRLIDRN